MVKAVDVLPVQKDSFHIQGILFKKKLLRRRR